MHSNLGPGASGEVRRGGRLALQGIEGMNDEPEWNAAFIVILRPAREGLGIDASRCPSAAAPRTAAISIGAGMIDRPDRDIGTGTAGAGRRRKGGADGKNERPLPYRSRSRCPLGLGRILSACGRKPRGWQ